MIGNAEREKVEKLAEVPVCRGRSVHAKKAQMKAEWFKATKVGASAGATAG